MACVSSAEAEKKIKYMKLVVGLGNPEQKYKYTRHNFGFLVLDKLNSNWSEKKDWQCQVAKLDKNILCKPLTYMNNSGQAVTAIANYYKINPEDIIVVHDDLDLPLGKIRIGVFSSSAGHNGIKSIQSLIGDNFIRLRLGIGQPKNPQQAVADYVLENFSAEEKNIVEEILSKAQTIITDLTNTSLEKVQNLYN